MKRKDFLPFGKPNFSEAEIAAVTEVLRRGWVGMGPETIAFEQELQTYCGAPHVLTVNSCTSALFLALKVLGVGPGDEVIVPSLTWCSTANAALYLGATPVFCDVDPETLSVTPELVAEKITARTRAVIVVHMGGRALDVRDFRTKLPEHIYLVEDAAHALGARYPDGSQVGSSGNLTCFSFYANKNLSTGEGGAVALFDNKQAERIRSLRQHGLNADAWKRFTHPKNLNATGVTELGYKMNYTDFQACIGRVQLKRFPEFARIRKEIVDYYLCELSSLLPSIRFQKDIDHPYHARHLCQIMLPVEKMRMSRNELLLALRDRNLGASIHYAPLHTMPLYEFSTSLPNTDDSYSRILTLPISSSMTLADAHYVVDALKELLESIIDNEGA